MRFAMMIEPQQGMSYADQLALAQRAEAAGFEALFRSDHYESFPGATDKRTTDAWAVLAGLARETRTIRLGTLVSPVAFRQPGNLAKVIVTVDEMSGGRIDVGVGAGWHEDEHRRHGFPFQPIADRATMLEEELTIFDGLWNQPDGWSFQGRFFSISDARFRPKPTRRMHVITGSEGAPRGLRIAARHADEFNLSSASPERAAEKFRELDRACEAIGRDPATIVHSAMVGVLVGADVAEVRRRGAELMGLMGAGSVGGRSRAGTDAEGWLAQRRPRWIVGTPDEAREKVARYVDAGCQRIMLQDFLPWDLDMVDLLGREIVARA
jgi:F420-dependent oxidoreductase-like protein